MDEDVYVELPTPPTWKKLLIPKKAGAERKNEIVFIAPTGEEIGNKKLLDQYLKSYHGGSTISKFDWSMGKAPKRSARISVKFKATPPKDEPPKKRNRKFSGNKKEKPTVEEDCQDESEKIIKMHADPSNTQENAASREAILEKDEILEVVEKQVNGVVEEEKLNAAAASSNNEANDYQDVTTNGLNCNVHDEDQSIEHPKCFFILCPGRANMITL